MMREKERKEEAIAATKREAGVEEWWVLNRVPDSVMLPEADNEESGDGMRRGITKPKLLLMLWT